MVILDHHQQAHALCKTDLFQKGYAVPRRTEESTNRIGLLPETISVDDLLRRSTSWMKNSTHSLRRIPMGAKGG